MMDALFLVLLGIGVHSDLKKREIIVIVPIGICLISLWNPHPSGIFVALVFFLAALLFGEDGMGGGDIKLVAAVGLYMGLMPTIYGVIIGLSLAILSTYVWQIYRKKKMQNIGIPLAPFLSIGFMLMLIV